VVAEAESGLAAVEAFRRERPDVALIDLRMPGMYGAEVTAAIRRELPAARIIVISSFDGDEDVHRAFAAGAVTYVLKETAPEEVIATVRAVHAGRAPIPREIRDTLAARDEQDAVSAREREILRLMAGGLPNRQIAERLGISENTVRFHLKALFTKGSLHMATFDNLAFSVREDGAPAGLDMPRVPFI
jgi:DNA-binding NarL/FixJ family response regulator